MNKTKYNKTFRMKVVRESMTPEFENLEFIIAEKYGIRESTLIRWRDQYKEYGEAGLSDNFKSIKAKSKQNIFDIDKQKDKKIKELEEEIEILKKAAAFLVNLNRD